MKEALIDAFVSLASLFLVAVLVILYAYALGCFKSDDGSRVRRLAREMMEREAVIAGHAEWKSGTNGEPVFHWKSSKEAKP